MYEDAGVSPTGLLVKNEDVWEWTLTLLADIGTYEWNPHAKTLGWLPINPNMFEYEGDNGNNLMFTVGEDGILSGHYELVIPAPEQTSSSNIISNLFRIYPNPATEVVCIDEDNASGNMEYRLYNLKGQIIYQTIDKTIPVSALPSGTYILIRQDGAMAKVVKK
jgi:hypothetical protein